MCTVRSNRYTRKILVTLTLIKIQHHMKIVEKLSFCILRSSLSANRHSIALFVVNIQDAKEERIEAVASDRSGNRDACMRRGESCQSAMKFKDSRHSSVWKSAANPDCEDPPFITEYWSSTTLPSMRNPEDDIQQHVQRGSQGIRLKEHGHCSRVISRKGFVALSLTLA